MVAKKPKAKATKKREKPEKLVIKDKNAVDTPVDKLETEKQLIYERLAPLRDQAHLLKGIRNDRDVLNDKVKVLSEEVRKIKTQRDELNEKVQAEKKRRDDINKDVSSMRKGFVSSFGDAPPRKGSQELQRLRKQVKDMHWDIETKGYTFKKEKEKREQLEKLEKRLKTMEKYDTARFEVVKGEKSARKFHSNVLQYSHESEKIHEQLITLYDKLKAARERADAKHNEVVEALDKLKQIEAEHDSDLTRLSEIRDQIKETREDWEDQKVEESKKSARERGAEAYAEFEKGGRVDLRDLQLKFLGKEGKGKRK